MKNRHKVYPFFKRLFDIIFSLLLIILLFPLMLIIALVIRIDSPGRAIFRQERLGKDQKPFSCLKFRTMKKDAPQLPTFYFDTIGCYVTRPGRVLREFSLDELPQLYNIFIGQMSFIGPRPVILQEEELIRLRASCGVYALRPGLSGLAQVRGRNELNIEEKAGYDLEYMKTMSLKTDLKILFETVSTVLSRRGYLQGEEDGK